MKDKIIEKQKELIEALNNQIALVCSDSFKDMEGYGYKALASSQKITQLESELAALEAEEENIICDGCNVREPFEHRCHGRGCNCTNPVCMEYQGKITHEELMEIISRELNLF